MPTRTTFETELKMLELSIMEMTEQAEHAFHQVMQGLQNQDAQVLKQVKNGDHLINDMQRAIEARCLTLIARQSPVARDLRMVSAALKVVTDIERIGDHASDIAELLLQMQMPKLGSYSEKFDPMIDKTLEMLHSAACAFVNRDAALARAVIGADDVVDRYFLKIREELIRGLKEEECDADGFADALMIAKYLERVADHAVNICEWEGFQETGVISNTRIF